MTTASNFSDGAANGYEKVDDRKRRDGAQAQDLAGLPRRESSLCTNPHLIHGQNPPAAQPRLVVFPAAVEQIMEHATSTIQSEVGGVLLGMAYRHEDEIHVDVRAALPVRSDDHGPIHFTFNADAWAQVHRERTERYPELNIVGWFHTHPGLGIFFSGDDVVVHSAAFVMPWHVAFVVDPVHRKMGAFGWQAGELAPLAGIFEVTSENGAPPQLPWQMQRGNIWDETYLERMAAARTHDVERADPFILPALRAWHGVALGALSLVISLILLFGAVLPLTNQNEALTLIIAAQADRTIAVASAEGAADCPDPSLRLLAPVPDANIAHGAEVTLVGTANLPDQRRYRLDVRPFGEMTWWQLGSVGRPVVAGALLTWDTSSFSSGTYELRLTAAERSGEEILGAPACTIRFNLVSPLDPPAS